MNGIGTATDAAPRAAAVTDGEATRDRGAADAALLLRRMGEVLGELALAVDGLQVGLGPTIMAAAARDPGLAVEAQTLDLVSQTLRGLMDVLAAVGEHRLGQEPLPFDRLAASAKLKSLADRMTGSAPSAAADDLDLF